MEVANIAKVKRKQKKICSYIFVLGVILFFEEDALNKKKKESDPKPWLTKRIHEQKKSIIHFVCIDMKFIEHLMFQLEHQTQ